MSLKKITAKIPTELLVIMSEINSFFMQIKLFDINFFHTTHYTTIVYQFVSIK